MIEVFLTFTAIVLAYLALSNRITTFRRNMGFLTDRYLVCFFSISGVIALFSILISDHRPDFLDSMVSYVLNILSLEQHQKIFVTIGHLVFILWNAGLVFIVIYFLYKHMNPSTLEKRNAKKFLSECNLIIASGEKNDIRNLVSEVSNSFEIIFDSAASNSGEMSKISRDILDLFSDLFFCKSIVNHNLVALKELFRVVILSCDRDKKVEVNFITRVIFLMFEEPDSILNREERYYGLGRAGFFKKFVFGNVKFLSSEYRPLSQFNFINYNSNEQSVSKYFEILKYSLEVYLKDGDKKPDIFYLALHNISDNIGRDVYSLRDYHENEIDYSQAYRKIGAYYSGILSLIDYVNAKPDFFPYEIRFESENYSYTSDHNIFGALADGIYRAIQVLSRKPSLYEMERRLLAEIYLMWDRGSMALRSIQDRLDILLSEEIGGRLRDKLYSTLSAGLIYSFGLYEPEKARCNIHKLLLNALKKNYIKKHSLNPDAAQKMLPMDTKFDKVSKKLIRIDPNQWFEDQRVQELTLEQEV